MLPAGELPPDECIEIALWDRFGWGPNDTDTIAAARLRKIFSILEQQRVTRDAIENLGNPNPDRMEEKIRLQAALRGSKTAAKQVDEFPPGSKIIS